MYGAGRSNQSSFLKLQSMLSYDMDYSKLYEKQDVVERVPVKLPASLPDTPEMRSKAVAVEPDIFAVVYGIMMDETASDKDRLAASALMLDRGRGKAVQSVEVNQRVLQLSQNRIEIVLVDPNAG